MRDHFGYGHVPASSAIVESDFNNLKTRLLKKKVGLRADSFVQMHLQNLNGHSILINANNNIAHTESTLPQPAESVPPLQQTNLTDQCPACANGDFPTGAHKCSVCSIAVHIFEQCSVDFVGDGDREGYGQKRICISCKNNTRATIEENISQREIEKWGGLDNVSFYKTNFEF